MFRIIDIGGKMEIRFTILAKNEEAFDIQLGTKMIDSLKKVVIDNTKILTIQFEDAQPYIIDDYINKQFCMCDGVYLSEGKFYWREELYKMIQPYCKTCSVTVAEKELHTIKQSNIKEFKIK